VTNFPAHTEEIMVRTKQQRRRDRKRGDPNSPPPPALANVTAVVHGTDQVTVTTDGPIQIDPTVLPTSWLFNAHAVTSFISSTGTVTVLGVAGTVAASEPYVIGAQDGAVRTPSGGYVAGSSGVMT
jgi:hypothetical protein